MLLLTPKSSINLCVSSMGSHAGLTQSRSAAMVAWFGSRAASFLPSLTFLFLWIWWRILFLFHPWNFHIFNGFCSFCVCFGLSVFKVYHGLASCLHDFRTSVTMAIIQQSCVSQNTMHFNLFHFHNYTKSMYLVVTWHVQAFTVNAEYLVLTSTFGGPLLLHLSPFYCCTILLGQTFKFLYVCFMYHMLTDFWCFICVRAQHNALQGQSWSGLSLDPIGSTSSKVGCEHLRLAQQQPLIHRIDLSFLTSLLSPLHSSYWRTNPPQSELLTQLRTAHEPFSAWTNGEATHSCQIDNYYPSVQLRLGMKGVFFDPTPNPLKSRQRLSTLMLYYYLFHIECDQAQSLGSKSMGSASMAWMSLWNCVYMCMFWKAVKGSVCRI